MAEADRGVVRGDEQARSLDRIERFSTYQQGLVEVVGYPQRQLQLHATRPQARGLKEAIP